MAKVALVGQTKVFDELIKMGYGIGNMPPVDKIEEAVNTLLEKLPSKMEH